MDTALVTGADRGIGLQIARQLVELGYRVYGLAADFTACNWQHHDFLQIRCDLSRTDHLQQAWQHISEHNPQVGVVVHALPSPVLKNGFEGAAAEDIAHCVQSGLLAALLLTRWALPSLVRFRGHVIDVGWNAQGSCPQGAIAAAVEGGLHHWTQSLFDELRDTGVKVCTVYPWHNAGTADPKARLKLEPQSEVDAKFFAKAVAQILQAKENNLLTQIVVRPQGTREEPRIAPGAESLPAGPKDIVLPDPDKRPPPPEPILTPEPRRPDDAWEFDDDDEDEWEADDELDALLESSRRILREQNEAARRQLQRTREKSNRQQQRDNTSRSKSREPAKASEQVAENLPERATENLPRRATESLPERAPTPTGGGSDSPEDESKRRRRRRRGGRGRNRRQDAESVGSTNENTAATSHPARQAPSDATTSPKKTVTASEAAASPKADSPKPPEVRQTAAKPAEVRQPPETGGKPATDGKSATKPQQSKPATTEASAKTAIKPIATKPADTKAGVKTDAKATTKTSAVATIKQSVESAKVKPATKKVSAKKAATKKTAVKKTATKKAVTKKTAVKKAAVKKTAVKKAAAKRVANAKAQG